MSLNFSIRRALRDWINLSEWSDPRAVTLTMKQHVRDQKVGAIAYLDASIASKNLRHFLNLLNRRLIGNVGRRHGKWISVLSILEGTATKHLHYHLLMNCPLKSDTTGLFENAIRTAWAATEWGDHQIHISPADAGWITYITKYADKPVFADSIDWTNTHLGTRKNPSRLRP